MSFGWLVDDESESCGYLWVIKMCQWPDSLYIGWRVDDESEIMGKDGLQNVSLSSFSLHWQCLAK